MNKREIVIEALDFRPPPYVPWDWGPTIGCAERLRKHLGAQDLSDFLDPHFAGFGAGVGRWEEIDPDHVRDTYGVVWDRTIDKDIGSPCDWPIKRPQDLDSYTFPDANNPAWYANIPAGIAANKDRFSIYYLGFSLYERAWTMRGMDDLLMDMVERPEFVEKLLDQITDHNMIQIRNALAANVDAVYFGDDYGMQTGLIMGLSHWRHFIKPRLARMFGAVHDAGKRVTMHSCGKVDSLFDDLVEIGLNMFNPFQPEVMDTFALMKQYHGRLAFHGGMSVQKVLPFGTVKEVREAAEKLVAAGSNGGFVFAPSHGVPYDVPPENLVAMVEVLKSQPGYKKA